MAKKSSIAREVAETLKKHLDRSARVDPSAWIAKSAEIYGDVVIGPKASIWPKAVVRADINAIHIGEGTNIQDGSILHLADEYALKIGDYCTIGHGAILHACSIGNEVLVGMRATVLDGAIIGDQCIIGAHALVTGRSVIPPRSMVLGSPAKVVRSLTKAEIAFLRKSALKYIEVSSGFRARGLG